MSTVTTVKGVVDIQRLPVNSEEQKFHDWTVKYKQSHILHSQCATPTDCKEKEKCTFCMYNEALVLPHMPDMVFPNNVLTLTHDSGAEISFNALDALKSVSNGRLPFKVACADVWQESRSEVNLEEKVTPFDWTFSTDYKGTISDSLDVAPTEERINVEKLKEREKILFYNELTLYEDELHDNGIASCTVKIRVMPSSFFLLLRYFLRVDNVMVRVNDTRVFHEFEKDYLLREYTSRESGIKELNLPLNMFTDANIISPHLPLRSSQYEKLTWNN